MPMLSFLPLPSPTSNRVEAMYFQSWQAGYVDIVKRGFPQPKNHRAVLVELRSPQVSDFLHGSTSQVPFVVSERARSIFRRERLTGFEYAPAIVTKVATKGLRRRQITRGEPEDSILKSRGVGLRDAPSLYAVRVTGVVEVIPDFASGRSPSGAVSPFRLSESTDVPDVWRPAYKGSTFSAWAFCSERFRSTCEHESLSNIKFRSFEAFMEDFRRSIANDEKG